MFPHLLNKQVYQIWSMSSPLHPLYDMGAWCDGMVWWCAVIVWCDGVQLTLVVWLTHTTRVYWTMNTCSHVKAKFQWEILKNILLWPFYFCKTSNKSKMRVKQLILTLISCSFRGSDFHKTTKRFDKKPDVEMRMRPNFLLIFSWKRLKYSQLCDNKVSFERRKNNFTKISSFLVHFFKF